MCDKNYLRSRHVNDIKALIKKQQSSNSIDDFIMDPISTIDITEVKNQKSDLTNSLHVSLIQLHQLDKESGEAKYVSDCIDIIKNLRKCCDDSLQKLSGFKPTVNKTVKKTPKKPKLKLSLKQMFLKDEENGEPKEEEEDDQVRETSDSNVDIFSLFENPKVEKQEDEVKSEVEEENGTPVSDIFDLFVDNVKEETENLQTEVTEEKSNNVAAPAPNNDQHEPSTSANHCNNTDEIVDNSDVKSEISSNYSADTDPEYANKKMEEVKLEETDSIFSKDTLHIKTSPQDVKSNITIKVDLSSSRVSTCYDFPAETGTNEIDISIKGDLSSSSGSTCYDFPVDICANETDLSVAMDQPSNENAEDNDIPLNLSGSTVIGGSLDNANDNHSVGSVDSNATECLLNDAEIETNDKGFESSSSDKTEIIDKDFPLSGQSINDTNNEGTSNDEDCAHTNDVSNNDSNVGANADETILNYFNLKRIDLPNSKNTALSKADEFESDCEDMNILDNVRKDSDDSSLDSHLLYDSISMDSLSSEESIAKPINRKRKIIAKKKINNISLSDKVELKLNPCFVRMTEEERMVCDDFYSSSVTKKRKKSYLSTSSASTDDETVERNNLDDDFSDGYENLLVPISNEDEMRLLNGSEDDELLLNGIEEKDDFSENSYDESSDGSKKENKKDKVKVKKKKVNKAKDINAKWKDDALLRGKLVSDSDSDDCIMKENSSDEVTIKEEPPSLTKDQIREILKSAVIEQIVLNSSSDSDSDIELITDVASEQGSELNDSQKKGRKNIRDVLSSKKLEISTLQAHREEKIRLDRLQEKQKKMDLYLLQKTDSEGDLEMILDATDTTDIIKVHPNLVRRLKKHQIKGVVFMWNTCYESVPLLKKNHPGSGCILAHCMGLGKTFQVVTLIHTLFNYPVTKTKHVLVVCPISIVLNWKKEFKIGLDTVSKSEANCLVFAVNNDNYRSKTQKYALVRQWNRMGGVLIIGYETFRALIKVPDKNENDAASETVALAIQALVNPGPDLIVCDEGHLLKNGNSARTLNLMKITTKRRIIMTGTPLQNNLEEYYHMVQFVKPNLLGTKKEYRNRFVNPIENGQYENSTLADINVMKKRSHVLHTMLKGTIQRFEESELKPYLPILLDYAIEIIMCRLQIELYKKCIEKILLSGDTVKHSLFSHYNLLHHIWTHPYLLQIKPPPKPVLRRATAVVEDGILEEANMPVLQNDLDILKSSLPFDLATNILYGPKFKIMLDIILACEKLDEKILIFSSSMPLLSAIEHFMKNHNSKWRHGINYLRIDGTVSPDVRQKYCDLFNSPGNKFRFFLISHKVGGMGINLIAANRVILMDVAWNPALDNQSIFRIYRFGQTKNCYVYRFYTKGTMEEVMYERSVTKQAISGRVVDKQQINRHYKSEDLTSMYRCNIDYKIVNFIPKLPSDDVLANLLQSYHHTLIFNYHEHRTLLANVPHEALQEEERQAAWDEYNNERNIAEQQEKQQYYMANLSTPEQATNSNRLPPALAKPVYLAPIQNYVPRTQFSTNRIPHRTVILQKLNAANSIPPSFIETNAALCETLNRNDLRAIQESNVTQGDLQYQQNTMRCAVLPQIRIRQNDGLRRIIPNNTSHYTKIPNPNAILQRNNAFLNQQTGNSNNVQTGNDLTIQSSLSSTNSVPSADANAENVIPGIINID